MKIVIAEKMSSSAMNLLREPDWTVITPDQLNGSLAKELETADALLVRSAVQVDAALLANASKLRVIGRKRAEQATQILARVAFAHHLLGSIVKGVERGSTLVLHFELEAAESAQAFNRRRLEWYDHGPGNGA